MAIKCRKKYFQQFFACFQGRMRLRNFHCYTQYFVQIFLKANNEIIDINDINDVGVY